MQQILRSFTQMAVLVLLVSATRPASAIETEAREALLIDATTGAVLLEKNADQAMPPASMSKIMTAYLVFERLKDGRLSLDDTLPVSENAWRKGGSKMFVEVGNRVRVEDLLRGVIVQSGNDACIVLAEGLAGSEEAFAEEMTRRGYELGLENSQFINATGWPNPNHRMTAADLARLAELTIKNFPDYYHYYSETEFTWHGIRQPNRNPLLYMNIGADGLKTGHTEEAGFGLAASAEQEGRRLILVVNGLPSERARSEEADRLLGWGFREFDNYVLFKANDVVEEAPVWHGQSAQVPLVSAADAMVTLPRAVREDMTVTVKYQSPIPAPIAKGQQVGTIVVSAPDAEPTEFPLLAGADVGRLGPFGRIVASVKSLIFGTY